LQDKYGVSWQIVPSVLSEMLNSSDQDKGRRVMQAMLQMKKIDVNVLWEVFK
jgi:predicted 3-demethylubiquinone-9 3-methyltransferase (glyoxalase superfamily)